MALLQHPWDNHSKEMQDRFLKCEYISLCDLSLLRKIDGKWTVETEGKMGYHIGFMEKYGG